ncbi:MAG: T9SS type A sorting domain-containing protein [Ignavibacteriae bacterium]|nr:T9SS type A sorting domain-containing protein [Ignavibacteriota bacterium]
MNKNKLNTLLILLIAFFTAMEIGAEGELNSKSNALSKAAGSPSRTRLNINNISTWIYNDGNSDIDPNGNSGFIFPKGSNKAAVFESGLVWGAKVSGELRVGGSTYSQGLVPGAVVNGEREDSDADHVRIYRVRPDWEDGSMISEINDGEGAEADIRAQYEKDWNEWPAEFGAPYEDVDADGSYDPSIDIPGFPGANQTVWFVANDFDRATAQSLYGSDPMGIEMQATFWGYSLGGALGNVMFRKYTLINKSSSVFDSMFVSMWSDIDNGFAGDDLSACDVDRSLMYCYNGDEDDDGIYGPNPPAVGFDFFQGPIVPGEATDQAIFKNKRKAGYKNLPMSVHYFFINGHPVYNDPDLGEYVTGTLQFHNLFRGLITTSGEPFIDPTTGEATKFTLAGDPITGTGWVDGVLEAPDDRRQGMVAGPFTMAPGDTQEVVVAELAAGATPGVNRLQAIQLLRIYDDIAQSIYDNFFELPSPPPSPIVTVTGYENEVIVNWGEDQTRVDDIELNYEAIGIANRGKFNFQGYNLYQLPSRSATKAEAVRIGTFDIVDEVKVILDQEVDPESGVTLMLPQQFGDDNGVQHSFQVTKDYITGEQLENGTTYYFAVTAYAYNPDPLHVPNTLETPLNIMEVIPQNPDPGYTLPDFEYGDGLEVTQTTGTANAVVTAKVVDPMKLTGHDYEVYFDQQHYYLDKDGKWKKTNFADSVGASLGKPGDQGPSTITAAPSIYAPNNTLDLHFTVNILAPDFNYADAVQLKFPDGIKVNSANTIESNHEAVGVVNGQVVTWGSPDTTGDGAFVGGEDLVVNIDFVDPTFSVDYVIFDDGWSTLYALDSGDSTYLNLGNGIVDGLGTVTLTGETGYQFKTEKHWNVKDLTTGQPVIEDQRVLAGVNVYTNVDEGANAAPLVDGIQVAVDGSYVTPINFFSVGFTAPVDANGKYTGESSLTTAFGATATRIAISNYTVFGGTISSWAYDNFNGIGTTDLDILQQDYELRFTGIWDSTEVNGQKIHFVKEGGQMATCFTMVAAADLANHPLNPNPGTAAPFLIRIPFEVWNVADPANPYQVNLTYRDRLRNGTQNPFYAWNMSDRMYAIIVNSPYNPDQVIPGAAPDPTNALATWVLVFTGTNYHLGDAIKITYANPLQLGKDTFRFKAPATTYSAENAKNDVKNVNVFPNPYYGVNPNEINKYQRYVTFNHLPPKAKIRIFNLGGQLVRTLDKDDASQFLRWDLSNESSLPVASGLYLAYIDMPELGKTKILKVAIIQETQILDRF